MGLFSLTDSNVLADVGDSDNNVTCGIAESLEESLGLVLINFIHELWGLGETLPTAQQLCAHTSCGG